MKQLALTLLVSSALAAVYGGSASAQTQIGPAFDRNFDAEIDGEEVNGTPVYIRVDQCSDTVSIKFIARNYLVNIPVLEVWASTAPDCNLSASRATTNNNASVCWFLGNNLSVQGNTELTVTTNTVFRNGSADTVGCPELAGTRYQVYFVPLASPTDANPANPPDPLAAVQQVKGTFTLYTKRPAAPGGLKPLDGKSGMGVEWSAAVGAVSTTEYQAYFDTSIGNDATCANTKLVEGEFGPEPDNSDIYRSASGKELSATLVDLGAKRVAINDYVAAAVRSKDVANNASTLSEIVCIRRVTDRMPDLDSGDPDDMDSGDPDEQGKLKACSLRQGTRRGALSPTGLLLVGLGFAFAIRRRRV
jgi:hypothetical protein